MAQLTFPSKISVHAHLDLFICQSDLADFARSDGIENSDEEQARPASISDQRKKDPDSPTKKRKKAAETFTRSLARLQTTNISNRLTDD